MNLQLIKKSTALIDANDSIGTGYLVANDLIITCEHVVRGAKAEEVTLKFWTDIGGFQESVKVKNIFTDKSRDIAILELSESVDRTPLEFAKGSYNAGIIDVYGYPKGASGGAIWIKGEIRDESARQTVGYEQKHPALQIYSQEIHSESPQGFSGSPVFMEGRIVGHLRSIIPNRETSLPSAMFGVLYAVKGSDINEFLAKTFPERFNLQRRVVPQPVLKGYNPSWYIKREHEEQLATKTLEEAGSITVQGSYMIGKSTFISHILSQIKNKKAIYINIRLFDDTVFGSLDALLKEIVSCMFRELHLDESIIEMKWKNILVAQQKFRNLVEKFILPLNENGLILAFDNTDKIYTENLNTSFYSMIRGIMDEGDHSVWSNVGFVFSISTHPSNLIHTKFGSPFEVSTNVNLKDINGDEFIKLLEKFYFEVHDDDIIKVSEWVGGNPYLLRALCFYAWATELKLNDVLSEEILKDIFSSYLGKLRNWLINNPSLNAEFEKFKEGKIERAEDVISCNKLEMAGLLKKAGNKGYKLKYKLYELL